MGGRDRQFRSRRRSRFRFPEPLRSASGLVRRMDRRPESAASIRRLALRRPQRSSYGGMDRARRRSGPPRRRMRRRDPLKACRCSAFRIFGRPPDRAGGRRAAVCRRRPERGEPAGGTPRSRFSGVSSLPKTTSTRSLLGVWKHSFRLVSADLPARAVPIP